MDTLPSNVFAYWQVLMETEPCGEMRGDLHIAQLLSFAMAALSRNGASGTPPKMTDFVLDYWDDFKEEMTGVEVVNIIMTLPGAKKVKV